MEEMDRNQIDRLVLSLGPPGVDYFPSNLALATAKKVNDEFARFTEEYPERFIGLATLPFQEIESCLDEFDRAIKDLGLRGAMIFGNVAGMPLDSPEFWPLYKRAARFNIPLYIHPTAPCNAEEMMDYGLVFIIGFLFDTTIAITRLILSGVLEKYPSLKLVLAHLGSVVPYMLARLDIQWERIVSGKITLSGQPNYQVRLRKPPSEYFKSLYLDTVSLHPPAYTCAYTCSGPEKLLLGTDYPYWNIKKAIQHVKALPISIENQQKILGNTASNLFKIL